MKMTATRLDGLKASDRRQAFTDDSVPGLTLYVGPEPRGTKTWYWRGRINSTIISHKLGRYPAHTYAMARAWALEIISFRDLGRDIVAERAAETEAKAARDEHNGQWLFDTWIDRDASQRNKQSTIAEKRAVWKRDLESKIGAMSIHDIDHDVLDEIICAKASSAPIQANRLVALLCRMFNWATKQGRRETGLKANPAAYLYKPSRERKRSRVLNDRELGYLLALLDESSSDGAPGIRLIVDTGVRRSEAFRLEWPELDLVAGDWVLPGGDRTKNGLIFVVPLMSRTVSMLRAQEKTSKSQFVFWSRRSPKNAMSGLTKFHLQLYTAMEKMAVRDGHELDWWTLHDLRRTMATKMSGFRDRKDRPLIPPHVVEACLNHVSGEAKAGVAGVYNQHQYYAEKKAAYHLWHSHLESCRLAERRRIAALNIRLGA